MAEDARATGRLAEVKPWGGGGSPLFPHDLADQAFRVLVERYWDETQRYFHKFSDGSGWTDFWWEAQLWDSVMDVVERTGGRRSPWFALVAKVYDGQAKRTPTFLNKFYDDEAWWALACLRAYEITGDARYLDTANSLWDDIETGWSDDLGGGIWWSKDRKEKNACINGPAAILGARLYELTGDRDALGRAKQTLAWLRSHLLGPCGLVLDHIKSNGEVCPQTFTYNQGTFLGASVLLYRITGERRYLDDAVRVTDATLSLLAEPGGILKDEGPGDGGGFKAIFIRYLLYLYRCRREPPGSDYGHALAFNARAAWERARSADGLFGTSWSGPPPAGRVESLTHAAAVTLLNTVAALPSEEPLALRE